MPAEFGRLGNWVRTARRWTFAQHRAFLCALVLNPYVRRLLRRSGARGAAAFVDRYSSSALPRRLRAVDPVVVRDAKRIGEAVNRAAAEPAPAVTCLARSFTTVLLLRRSGTPAEVRIGVRTRTSDDPPDPARRADRMMFHAWAEVDGTPVNDVLDVADRFAVFPLEGVESFLRR